MTATATAGSPEPWFFAVAGTGTSPEDPFRGEGRWATSVEIDAQAVAALPDGAFLVADGWARVLQVRADGRLVTAAGGGRSTREGVRATAARLRPVDVATLPDGAFLVADQIRARVRRVGSDGRITTLAGGGTVDPDAGAVPARSARLVSPSSVAPLPGGAFLVVDGGRVRLVDRDGTLTTVAGNGESAASGDGGPATAAGMSPNAVAPLPGGGFLIAELANLRVRRVAPNGVIDTVAGTGRAGALGDGGPATTAAVAPSDVAALSGGAFLIADSDRVRRVGPSGTIATVAGGGRYLAYGEPATRTQLSPTSLAALGTDAFLVASGAEVDLVAGPGSRALGLADLLENEASPTRFSTRVAVSRGARVALSVWRCGRRLARTAQSTPRRGRLRLGLRHAFVPEIYSALTTATAGSRRAAQSTLVALGGVLLDRWVQQVAAAGWTTSSRARAADDPDPDSTQRRVRGCRRFGPTRVDCLRQSTGGDGELPFRCANVLTVRLWDTDILTAEYDCPSRRSDDPFKQRPAWDSWSFIDLSTLTRERGCAQPFSTSPRGPAPRSSYGVAPTGVAWDAPNLFARRRAAEAERRRVVNVRGERVPGRPCPRCR